MTSRTKIVDWGGLTVRVNDVEVGCTKPGQTGTALSATELGFVDGVTAGTVTASKAVVAGSDSTITGLGVAKPIIADGAAVVLTPAQSGGIIVLDKVDGSLATLPTPAVGLTYEFAVIASVTSSSMKVITNAGTVFIVGSATMVDTDTTFTHTNQDANGTTHVAVTMAAASTNSTGGIKGTHFRLTCISATQWLFVGDIHHAGSVATPFTTS